MSGQATEARSIHHRLANWLTEHTGEPGPWELQRLTGGNSNETCLLRGKHARYVLRRPPEHALSSSAHSVAREHRLLVALEGSAVPAPKPIVLCEDLEVPLAPFLLMEHVPNAISLTDQLPDSYGPRGMTRVANELVDALAAVHRMDWRTAGLNGFARKGRFLDRQVPRWYGQWQSIAQRPLPAMHRLAEWLERNQPPGSPPALMHGDFHLDNCLFSASEPRVLAVIDWEMATVGDPLMDLGLLLAFWGERPLIPPAMPFVQAVSRRPDAPPREHLLARYEDAVGRRVEHVRYYRCLAFFKLAAIIEAAWSQYLAGELRTEYAAALEHDVPALLTEALETAQSSG